MPQGPAPPRIGGPHPSPPRRPPRVDAAMLMHAGTKPRRMRTLAWVLLATLTLGCAADPPAPEEEARGDAPAMPPLSTPPGTPLLEVRSLQLAPMEVALGEEVAATAHVSARCQGNGIHVSVHFSTPAGNATVEDLLPCPGERNVTRAFTPAQTGAFEVVAAMGGSSARAVAHVRAP